MEIERPAYADIVDMWRGFDIRSSVQLGAHLDSFAILFSYNSGTIENKAITYHDTREIFEHGRVVNFTGDTKTLFEIENLKRAYETMVSWFDARRPIDQDLIRELHGVLTRGTYDERRWELGERPGRYKVNDVWGVGPNDLAAPASDVETEIADALEQIEGVGDAHVLTAAAWFHAKFEGIHAFADGNGRVGRALLNYHLILNDHPPVIVYQEDKGGYYAALEEFDKTGNPKPVRFFLEGQVRKTWHPLFDRQAGKGAPPQRRTQEPSLEAGARNRAEPAPRPKSPADAGRTADTALDKACRASEAERAKEPRPDQSPKPGMDR